MRALAIVSYNGAMFFGSQAQNGSNVNTVMGAFEKALRSVGIFGAPVASGRTDAGVHALRQPIAFDVPIFWAQKLDWLRLRLNEKLYPYIQIRDIFAVDEGFHPRFCAKARGYRYLVSLTPPTPFGADFLSFSNGFSFEKTKEAIGLFEGEHNFKFFKKTGSDEKSDVRIMYKAFAYLRGDICVLRFEANAFLRSQIRLMTGALFDLSSGKISKEELREQIAGKKRYTSKMAPPNGLYLSCVKY